MDRILQRGKLPGSFFFHFFATHDESERLRAEVASLKKRIKLLEQEVLVDHLTGLYNRRGAEMGFRHLFSLLKRGELEGLGLLMIDLDNFKAVNDTFGHLEGDVVLRHVADIMRSCCRSSDEICRLGGDEFLVILVGETADDTLLVAEKLRIETRRLCLEYSVTASIGAMHLGQSVALPDSTDPFIYVIDAIDQALYASKKQGKNSVTQAFLS